MAAKKIKDDLWYLTVAEIMERTTYSRRSVEIAMADGKLKSEKKGGKRVVKYQDFADWWNNK